MLSPQAKKHLSALAVAVVLAVLGVLQVNVHMLPPALAPIALAVIGYAVHYADAWGKAERLDQAIAKRLGGS